MKSREERNNEMKEIKKRILKVADSIMETPVTLVVEGGSWFNKHIRSFEMCLKDDTTKLITELEGDYLLHHKYLDIVNYAHDLHNEIYFYCMDNRISTIDIDKHITVRIKLTRNVKPNNFLNRIFHKKTRFRFRYFEVASIEIDD